MLVLSTFGHMPGPPVFNMAAHSQFLRSYFFKLCVRGSNQIYDRVELRIR